MNATRDDRGLTSVIRSALSVLTPVHREGYRFIAIFAAVTAGAFLLSDVLGWIGLGLTGWCAYFFRDPERVTPVGPALAIAPADGRVCAVTLCEIPPELKLDGVEAWRISIFMNVFDVHVNRSPVGAQVTETRYIPGKFLNATLDKASADNERLCWTLTMADGRRLGMVQIAGLVARRIVRMASDGDRVLAGERLGLIRFGSRVDVYLPPACGPLVAVGQRTIAGETVLAELDRQGLPREGRRQ